MIHEKMLDLVARRFQVLGEPCRLRILQALKSGAMTVNQIVESLHGNQPNISKHLQILFDAGLVSRERSGNSIFYSIADPYVFELCDLVCHSAARQAERLQQYAMAAVAGSQKRAVESHTKLRAGSLRGAI